MRPLHICLCVCILATAAFLGACPAKTPGSARTPRRASAAQRAAPVLIMGPAARRFPVGRPRAAYIQMVYPVHLAKPASATDYFRYRMQSQQATGSYAAKAYRHAAELYIKAVRSLIAAAGPSPQLLAGYDPTLYPLCYNAGLAFVMANRVADGRTELSAKPLLPAACTRGLRRALRLTR